MNALQRMKDARLKAFTQLWNENVGVHKRLRKDAANWNELYCFRWSDPIEANALRAAGAFVDAIGLNGDGDLMIEITNWNNFNPAVFEVIYPDKQLCSICYRIEVENSGFMCPSCAKSTKEEAF